MTDNVQQSMIPMGYGIHRSPSIGNDGEFSELVNLMPKSGELVNIQPPAVISGVSLPSGAKLMAIHDVPNVGKKYIYLDGENLKWIGGSSVICTSSTIKSVTCIGNTIVVLSNDKYEYHIWRDNAYKSLGSSLPDIEVQLGLEGKVKKVDSVASVKIVTSAKKGYNYGGDGKQDITISDSLKGENHVTVYRMVMYYTDRSDSEKLKKGTAYRIQNSSNTDIYLYFAKTKKQIYDYLDTLQSIKIKKSDKAEVILNDDCYRLMYCTKDYQNWTTISLRIQEGELSTDGIAEIENSQENWNALKAGANLFLNDEMSDGKFVMPFFARVGLRLYDGSITKASIPILMTPNTGSVPKLITPGPVKDSTNVVSAIAASANLQYNIGASDKSALDDWKDIITGIVIGITPPIYEYDQSKEYTEGQEPLTVKGFTVDTTSRIKGADFGYYYGAINTGETLYPYEKKQINDIIQRDGIIVNTGTSDINYGIFSLPVFKESKILSNYTETSVFNVLKDIKIDDVNADTWNTVDTEDTDISVSESFEVFGDDYGSHDNVSAGQAIVYNSRLHISEISKSFWGGYNPLHTSGLALNPDNYITTRSKTRAIVKIVEDGITYYADSGFVNTAIDKDIIWYYYPNKNAVSAVIYSAQGTPISYYKKEIGLTKHKLLNGAYWFDNYNALDLGEVLEDSTEATREIPATVKTQSNMLYVSEANDPFTFPIHTTIGNGKILGLSTSAKAISQGQFGDFPLCAFCSDGIWALGVSNDGSYSSRQPVSRDVCISPSSITQLDGGVAFVTNQGLKVISGSEVSLLSGTLDGYNVNENFIESAINGFLTETDPALYVEDTAQFATQIANSRIVYDYPHNMLHVFPQVTGAGPYKHYVLSLDEKEWSTQVMDKDITAIVPGYPLTTIQMGTSLYTYDKIVDETARYGYALTRINYLGSPVCRKMLYDLRTIGQRLYNDSVRKVAVYVSDDKINWYALKSLKALSAKYYRFLVMTKMRDTETVSGITAQYVERFNNKMR